MARDKTDKTPAATLATPAAQGTDPHDAWRVVYDAYRAANPPNLLPEHLSQVGVFASQWVETKDPSVMDGAISYCYQNELPILPELLEYVHAAMQKRIADGSAGTKAFKKAAKQRILEEMAKLVYHGASIRRAAQLGAYAAHFNLRYPMKASSLEKEYTKKREYLDKFARTIFEANCFTDAERQKKAAEWRKVIEAEVLIPEEIVGDIR